MARQRMVTRTITVNTYEVMCVDTSTAEVTVKDYVLTAVTNDPLKSLQRLYNTDTFKLVAIQNIKETEEMYGMLETDFIKFAKLLDPATRKVLESECEE